MILLFVSRFHQSTKFRTPCISYNWNYCSWIFLFSLSIMKHQTANDYNGRYFFKFFVASKHFHPSFSNTSAKQIFLWKFLHHYIINILSIIKYDQLTLQTLTSMCFTEILLSDHRCVSQKWKEPRIFHFHCFGKYWYHNFFYSLRHPST